MTSNEYHRLRITEHLQVIEDALAVGIEQRAATIALHVSACSIDLVELYLHTLGKITGGTVVKHDWFKAPQLGQKSLPLAERKLGVPFPHKEKILLLLYAIEEHRNKLIYGKPSAGAAELVLRAFQELHILIKSELEQQGVSIA